MSANPSIFLGVVTVLYNSNAVLPDFFESLAKQTALRYRLYVIDNSAENSGSQLSQSLATQLGVDVRILFNNANLGVAKGNNQGITMALNDGCTHILLANNDTVFAAETFTALMDPLLHGGEAATTCMISYYDNPDRLWYENGEIRLFRASTPHIHFPPAPDKSGAHYVHYAPTCFLLLRSDVFEQVGLMDEEYFVYYDDSDFIWRMHKHFIKIRLVPRVLVQHKVSSSTGGDDSPFSVFYMHRNRIRFARKHNPRWLAPASVLYICVACLFRGRKRPSALRRHAWRGLWRGIVG